MTIFVYDAGGKLAAEYTLGVAANSNPQTSYITTDTLGSTRLVTNGAGQVVARHDYLPFGDEIYGLGGRTSAQGFSQPDSTRQRFTGYEHDSETGLDFAQARYYGNGLGRFTTIDPLSSQSSLDPSLPQGWNAYVYVHNNPLLLTDHSGKSPDWWQQFLNFWAFGYLETDQEMEVRFNAARFFLTNLTRIYPRGVYARNPDGTMFRLDPSQLNNSGLLYYAQELQNAIDQGKLRQMTQEEAANAYPGMPEIGSLGDLPAAGTSKPANNVVSKIKDSPRLSREAQRATRNQSVQREIDDMVTKLTNGNMNPGIGSKSLFNGITEARSAGGGRVYFRSVAGQIEILAKSSKANQRQVIDELRKLYGK